MDTKLIIEIAIAVLGLLGCGTFIFYKVHNNKKTKQKNITIQGNKNKVIGGDDNSITL